MKTLSIILICLFLSGCGEPTSLEKWQRNQHDRCRSLSGRVHFEEDGKPAECNRAPFARFPKNLFTTKFEG